ncbi:MAG: polyprenyl synthetase family protein, partial [Propionibacteriaceae bacterium]|nr:polyprenyl synthetase family protein [Propionibacteriaceae bacterium]
MTSLDPADPLSSGFRKEIQVPISIFLAHQREQLGLISDEFEVLADIAVRLASDGKRLRPAFCTWGYLAFADAEYPPTWIYAISASLDLLHVSALIHDDVMDSSATRRGVPAAHKQLEALHRERGLSGSPEVFGRNGAILLGNLMWSWSAEMANWVRLPKDTFQDAMITLDRIRTQVNAG